MRLMLLTRALKAKMVELVEHETGFQPKSSGPLLAYEHERSEEPRSTEFRVEVNGPMPVTYVVTISEVRTR